MKALANRVHPIISMGLIIVLGIAICAFLVMGCSQYTCPTYAGSKPAHKVNFK